MKKINLIAILITLFFCGNIQAQDAAGFKASGKAFIKVFTNYHSSFTGDAIHNEFEVKRAYFGYSAKFSNEFSGKVTIDVGTSGGKLDYTAFLKNAYFQYKKNKLTAKFGMIGLSQFKMQEKQWGNRYLYKSFQDQHKFGSSADLGLHLAYEIIDGFSVDASVLNGDGYKSLERDSVLKYTIGLTLKPLKGLDLRAYYDMMGQDNPQKTLAFYVGYTLDKLKIGAEYNMQMNNKVVEDQDLNGMSFYASYALKKAKVFGRFDQLSSNTLDGSNDPWNLGKDGSAVLLGVEFKPVKGIKITPNYQLWSPADGGDAQNSAYLSCEIAF